jgi:DNA invertase Pin-like site-specific DNA recombinase
MGENMKDDFPAGTEGRRRGLRGITGGVEPRAARTRPSQSEPGSGAAWDGMPGPGTPVVGYASCVRTGQAGTTELKDQASAITLECKRRGLLLTEVVAEKEIHSRKALARPALTYALDRIRSGDVQGLVVADLSRITRSAAELGTIIEWLTSLDVRLVAAAHGLDTESEDGRFAADMLVEVLRWERDRLSERTRNGLRAARMNGKSSGRRAVTDDPGLSERIAQMRAQGMTLQAIADRLNEEGVPTVRGGTKWRHSSVQAAAGYRRRRQRQLPVRIPVQAPPVGQRS